MPYDFHHAEFLHSDTGTPAGTPLDIFGALWRDDAFGEDAGDRTYVIEFAKPVIMAADPSRSPIGRIFVHVGMGYSYRYGLLPIAKMQGLQDLVTGAITTKQITTGNITMEEVSKWTKIESPKAAPEPVAVRLAIADDYPVNEEVTLPEIQEVRQVTEAELNQMDILWKESKN